MIILIKYCLYTKSKVNKIIYIFLIIIIIIVHVSGCTLIIVIDKVVLPKGQTYVNDIIIALNSEVL